MRKTWILLPFLVLCSCNGTTQGDSVLSQNDTASSLLSETDSLSESKEESVKESTSEDLDSLFDESLLGTWYVTASSDKDILNINETMVIFPNHHMEIGEIYFNFTGLFENDEEACQFVSEDKQITMVLQCLDDVVIWGYEDLSGTTGTGNAEREPYSSGLSYCYDGDQWPMEQINSYICTTGSVPAYEADNYKLHTGVSQLYDIPYAMVDIYGVPSDSASSYVSQLNQQGFEISKDPTTVFYVGSDADQTYYIKISQYVEDQELCIFIYNYQIFTQK